MSSAFGINKGSRQGELWIYSSASPASGYTQAVFGYGEKTARALDLHVVYLTKTDSPTLIQMVKDRGAPEIILGAGDEVDWALLGVPSPLLVKPRPYSDMHGRGPAMHRLRYADVEKFTQQKDSLLVLVSNPLWMAGQEADIWAQIVGWAGAGRLSQVSCSRSPRTNPIMWDNLCEAMGKSVRLNHAVGLDPANRYVEMLAQAAVVLVVGNSRAMASEAAMGRANIYLWGDHEGDAVAFIDEARGIMGDASQRYHAFMMERPPVQLRFEPHDVTQYHVRALVEAYRQTRDMSA